MNQNFRGGNALAHLYSGGRGQVAGMDYVGLNEFPDSGPNVAAPPSQMIPSPPTGRYVLPPQYSGGGGCRPVYQNPPGGCEMNYGNPMGDAGKMRALQQLAMANYVPQILLPLGDFTTKVKAGASFSFSPEGSVPLRITQLTIASSIAPFFVVTNFTVARLNLLAGNGGVPAENFIPNARHAPLEIPILAAGSQVIVTVTNFDSSDHFFIANLTAIDLTSASSRMVP